MDDYYGKIKFIGTTTDGLRKWKAYADSYDILKDKLESQDVISDDDWVDWMKEQLNISSEDLENEDGEWDCDKYDYYYSMLDLDDNDYKDFIESCIGNAYYQYYSLWDENLDMYVDEKINEEKYKELWFDKIFHDLNYIDMDKDLDDDDFEEIATRYLEKHLKGKEIVDYKYSEYTKELKELALNCLKTNRT